MTATTTGPPVVSMAEFDAIFESVKNWGRWGPDDQLGTLNYITPGEGPRGGRPRPVAAARSRWRSPSTRSPGRTTRTRRSTSSARRTTSTSARTGSASGSTSWAWRATATATPTSTPSATSRTRAVTYNGLPAQEVLTSKGATTLDIATYGNGLVGRGVLLDIPRFRGVKWLEPGEAVTRAELEACERAQGVQLGEGDIFVFRTGHHRRRLELGAWDNGYPPAGEGKAGLHVDTVPWMHERRIAAFLPDGDGEAVPSTVEGMLYPIHPLQIVAMGMLASDSLQFEDLAQACETEGRWEFMVVGLPLRLPGGTGSPWNPDRDLLKGGPPNEPTDDSEGVMPTPGRGARPGSRGGRMPASRSIHDPSDQPIVRKYMRSDTWRSNPRPGVTVAETELKAGALKLPSIFMQSLTMVAPGIAALFYTPVVVNQAGLAAPLAYPIAFVIVLFTAIVLAQLARAVPSAGGYYTYVSRGIHPRAGFLVSWLNIIYAPLVLGAVTVFGGYVISSSLGWTGAPATGSRSPSAWSP